ncbi:MAG: hypothetical protein QNJ51_08425 [Calothrix sp. MO_167.B12]|nr:hypothetical protein [Calothrix sp. MO_167.B12]
MPGFSPNQSAVNCMAWQTFIALNWKADPENPGQPDMSATASEFGTPPETTNNINPVVWETYKEASEVIDPNIVANWKSPQALPKSFRLFKNATNLTPTSNFGFKVLSATSKFTDGPDFVLGETIQAFTSSWLTAQNQSLTFYEIRVNEDEYKYISTNTLAIPQNQKSCAKGEAGLNLPSGSANSNQDKNCEGNEADYGSDGAIEIKAAWVELKDSSLYPKYKIAQAIIKQPDGSAPRQAVMGLVGLHIIHKVPNAQQFVWTTFEHIDNAPSTQDISNQNLKSSYMYYNLNCNPETDHYKCEENSQPQNKKDPKDPYTAPVQVVRLNEIPSDSRNINQAVWSTLGDVNAQSVFLNYQLIDTMWPNLNQPIGPNATTPLSNGNIQSGYGSLNYVANTTMETYFQQPQQQPGSSNLFNPGGCLGCHVLAPIASATETGTKARLLLSLPNPTVTGKNSSTSLASDYSFIFSQAQAVANFLQTNSESSKSTEE